MNYFVTVNGKNVRRNDMVRETSPAMVTLEWRFTFCREWGIYKTKTKRK